MGLFASVLGHLVDAGPVIWHFVDHIMGSPLEVKTGCFVFRVAFENFVEVDAGLGELPVVIKT